MGSNRKTTKRVRLNKAVPNKKNLKKDQERMAKNREILQEMAKDSQE